LQVDEEGRSGGQCGFASGRALTRGEFLRRLYRQVKAAGFIRDQSIERR
jgi:hypothetical protein